MNFIEIVDTIFINKHLYFKVSDDDKVSQFFIINRKLGKGFPEMARKFNHKNIDKASAIDMWYNFFKDVRGIPDWYWPPKNKEKKIESKKKEVDYTKVKIRHDFNDGDIEYLKKYFPEELKKELSKINKFEE